MTSYAVRAGETTVAVGIDAEGGLRLNGDPVPASVTELGPYRYRVTARGETFVLIAERAGSLYRVIHEGCVHELAVDSERAGSARAAHEPAGGRYEITAPLPSLVRRIEVSVGDPVNPDTGLLVLEAMKMENEMRSHRKGRVAEICVAQGAAVEKGQLLMVLEA